MPLKPASLSKLAQKLLQASGDQMEFLREHDFKNDPARHDDKLHRQLAAEFSAEVERATKELSTRYGKPLKTGSCYTKLVPLDGVVRYAIWRVGKKNLFVAAARPERDFPFLLALGVIAVPDATRAEKPAREKPQEQAPEPAPSEKWPLPGLTASRCERCVYLTLKPGETPAGQQDSVFEHWSALYKKWKRMRKKGETLGGIHGPTFVLMLPNGESFGDFTVSRYPGAVGETEEAMLPLVEQGLELMLELARATGRCSASIEKGKVFVCDNGRRIPLTQCSYRQLRTNADYARKAKPIRRET